ncbi:MAG: response regulator [Rhodobacteraceae bacterium]|nr:response regulator [Paracoccaceae bacterium]
MNHRSGLKGIPRDSGSSRNALAILFDNRDAKAAEAALKAKAAEAEAANRAKSRFLAAMSHEIRTPLNAIMGFSELLKMSATDAKTTSHADAILTAGGALMTLLTDLLDLTQPDTQLAKYAPTQVNLHDILTETAQWWQREAEKKGLALVLAIDPNVPAKAAVDGARLQKILNNLLGNAVKFTSIGQVGLTATSEPTDGTTTFTITDTGPGIAADALTSMTQSFDDAGKEFAKQHGGIGLGLSVCQNLVHQLGGTLHLQNHADGGCKAQVCILLAPGDDAEPVANPTPRTPRHPLNKRILVAEDNPLNQELMKTLLEDIGCQVTLAGDGVEAVELAGQGGYDAILMDITMPQLDGVAAAELIQSLPAPLSDVPIVACTAHVDEQSQARYRRAGMAGFLPKPVRVEDIAALLGDVTDQQSQAMTN